MCACIDEQCIYMTVLCTVRTLLESKCAVCMRFYVVAAFALSMNMMVMNVIIITLNPYTYRFPFTHGT